MKKEYYLIISLILMVFGEVLTIYSELYAAKLPGRFLDAPELFIKPIIIICIAGISLIFAYWLGYQASGNIWVVTVTSLTLLLVLEPVVIYAMLQEIPKKGAIVGFILGAAGLVSTVVL